MKNSKNITGIQTPILSLIIFWGVLAIVFSMAFYSRASWNPPTDTPPDANTPPPINTSDSWQVKEGALTVNTDGAAVGFSVPLGNVGIGTASPGYTLDVNGTGRFTSTIDQTGLSSTGWRHVRLGYEDSNNYFRLLRYGSAHSTASVQGRMFLGNYVGGSVATGGYIDFRPASNYTLIYPSGGTSGFLRLYAGGSERIRIQANGNVGIGTTSPGRRLQVNGHIRINAGSNANLIESTTGYLDLRSSHASHGLIIRDHTGGSTSWAGVRSSTAGALQMTGSGSYANLVVNTNGRVGINTASPSGRLHVVGGTNDQIFTFVGRSGGGLTNTARILPAVIASNSISSNRYDLALEIATGANRNFWMTTTSGTFRLRVRGNVYANSFFYTSDGLLKRDISTISGALDKITQLDGVYYKWNEGVTTDNPNDLNVGLIAQDVEKIFPEIVFTDEDNGLKQIDYSKLTAPIIEAIKELHKENQELQDKYEELEKRIEALENK